MATVVRKKPGESDDKLIFRFRKKTFAEKVLTEYKERQYYESPAEKRNKRKRALRRMRRKGRVRS